MTSFILKIIGIIAMIFDHTGYLVYGNISWFNVIGRIAYPIFAFQLIQGYTHTKNLKNYLIRLFLFAIVSQVPFSLYFKPFSNGFEFNIFLTLFLGLFAITLCDKIKEKDKKNFSIDMLLVILASLFISKVLPFNYGLYGLSLIFIFYFARNNKILMNTLASIIMITYYSLILIPKFSILYALPFILASLFSLCLINLYNGKEGYRTKIFYYFYPIHLLVLYLIYILINH